MKLFKLTKSLMNIPSVSGEEEAVGVWLRGYLESLGWTVELQQVGEERTGVSAFRQNNVIAYLNESPRVWFSTHMDTVPPFIAPSETDEKIYGRGSCDAKGIIAAQITAAEQLRQQGIGDIGLLYTVEEERASTGAKVANTHPLARKCEYMLNGEPTDNRSACRKAIALAGEKSVVWTMSAMTVPSQLPLRLRARSAALHLAHSAARSH